MTWQITINSRPPMPGEITTDQQMITIESLHSTKPDPAWETTDEAGHYHAWSGDELPTLTARTRHVPCDGACGGVCEGEGYNVEDWFCVLCDQPIEPQVLPDNGPKYIPGLTSWEGTVTSSAPPGVNQGDRISVRATDGQQVAFGTAIVDTLTGEASHGRITMTAHFYGTGPLGHRKAVS